MGRNFNPRIRLHSAKVGFEVEAKINRSIPSIAATQTDKT